MQSTNSEYGSSYLTACHFRFFLFKEVKTKRKAAGDNLIFFLAINVNLISQILLN